MEFVVVVSLTSGCYPGYVCYICLKTMSETLLRKCSGCKLLFYCCKEHQKLDWTNHKEFCKAVQLLLKEHENGELLNHNLCSEVSNKKLMVRILSLNIGRLLKRRLTRQENLLLCNQFLCRVCYTYKEKNMITCHDCSAAAYCSQEHKDVDELKHSFVCGILKRCLEYEKICASGFMIYASITDSIEMPNDMQSFIDRFIEVKTLPPGKEKYSAYHLSKIFTIPLTLIYVIEVGLPVPKMEIETLTVHVVGCRKFENNAFETWEYIFHFFKRLLVLNLIFIGPEASSQYLATPLLACKKCRSSRRINFKVESLMYHEYLAKENSEKPDVILAFHCGFYEYKECWSMNDTWPDSMKSFCSFPGALFAFTSYYEKEAKEDFKIFRKSCRTSKLEYLVKYEPNPYKHLLPHNPGVDNFESIVYNNCFITVVRS